MAKGTIHLNVEFSAVADEEGKFGRLAVLLGLADADHARGKCEHLWVACTRRGEADLPQWLVEQVLGAAGPDALVEAELASWAGGRGDSKTRRMRIGGAEKHCLWMAGDQAAKTEQSRKGGKSRAATASRAGGRFTSDSPAQTSPSEISSEISSDPIPDLSHHAHAIPPVPAQQAAHVPAVQRATVQDSRSVADRDPKPSNVIQAPHILPGSIARADARRRVINAAWHLGGEAFRALGAEGIEPGAFDPWAGLPLASSEGMKLLGARVDELLIGEPPNEQRALDVIRRRVEVAKAEGRHAKDGPTRQWITPMRLWDPVSFAKGAERSPEQVRPRAGPQGSAVRAPEQPRKIQTLNSKTRSTT